MDPQLLSYYEAIERASADMLAAARAGNWDEVVKLEGACVLLISQLKHAAQTVGADDSAAPQGGVAERSRRSSSSHADGRGRAGVDTDLRRADSARTKSRIMQRILVNDAEIRHLAEPWLQDLDDTLSGRRRTLH